MAINAISNTVRSAMCNAFVDSYDTGSSDAGGDYDGYTAAYATLLFKCVMSNPAYGAASNGVATANSISDDTSADDTGTAAVGRGTDRDNTTVHDFTIGTSGEDLNLNTVSITSGDTVSISSATITMPAS
jgi:hypothetical protein